MSTSRRLSNDDVKCIFDCLYNNLFPPERLKFQIVVVGSHGMKLSPPSYEFKDGIYVLLKPLKKIKGQVHIDIADPENDPRVPSNLKSLVFKETPPETCPWSLSGPQFPTPTAIQQRYCYPKGDPEYSTIKGGALWTAYKENGAEDFDWRILHVYYSAKRAGNKGPVQPIGLMSSAKRPKMQCPLPMPKLETPQRRPKIGSFGSSFDDSPLSFNMPVSPLKDASLVSILSKTASIDTESETIISPDRNFFDVQTEFEKANGIGSEPARQIIREKKDKRSRSNTASVSSHYHHYSRSHWYSGYPPYWSPYVYPVPLFHSNSTDSSNERHYQELTPPRAHSSSPISQFPIQETRKPFAPQKNEDGNVEKFVDKLKDIQVHLIHTIDSFRTHERNKCKEIMSIWGRQLAKDPSSSGGSVVMMEVPKKWRGCEQNVTTEENLKQVNDSSIERGDDILQL